VATINFPTLSRYPDKINFSPISNTQRHQSPLSGSIQTKEIPGTRWKVVLQYGILWEDDIRKLQAFLAEMNGMAGRCHLWDLSRETPRGVGTGTPLVKGGSQTGKTLNTDGWTPNQTGILLAGDYFEVNSEIKRMTANVNSDGSGNATLQFGPELRVSPSDNDPVKVNFSMSSQSASKFMLIDDNQDKLMIEGTRDLKVCKNIVLTFIEQWL